MPSGAVMPGAEAAAATTVEIQIEAVDQSTPVAAETQASPAPDLPATGRGVDDAVLPIVLIVGGVLALLAAVSQMDMSRRRLR
jgi:hypothetical protein